MQIIERKNLGHIFDVLKNEAYDIFGPVIKDSAIVYDQIENVADMPIGWHDKQDKGTYRLEKTEKPFVFAYAGGPQSIKKFLHPAEYLLWKAKKMTHGFEIVSDDSNADAKRKPAFIGVRSCELHAMQIQDKIFLEGPAVDPLYRQVRNEAFIVAVNCTHPGGTCFCTSMDTGPRVKEAYDIALTEILQGEHHYFLAKAGSKKGEEVLKKIPCKAAQEIELEAEVEVMNAAVNQIKKKLDTTNIKELLYVNSVHKHWDDVANRCLSCGNCTMVCPTCFCTTVEDRLDLTGEHAERWNKRDSCFSLEFSFIHTGPVRTSVSSRYRQWLTHKLGTWHDQFGTSGCVGCGRCITWCPVGIDITEELAAIRNN